MDKIIGIGMLVYCAGLAIYANTTKDYEFDLRFWAQIATSGFGGVSILAFEYKDRLFKMFSSDTKKKPKPVRPIAVVSSDIDEVADFEKIVALKNRALELDSKEMIDILVQLNTTMFVANIKKVSKK